MLYGEEKILDAFRRNPPDYVMIVHKFTGEYGFPYFGKDYGRALYFWVSRHYRPLELYGQEPLEEMTQFGIRVLERIRPRQHGLPRASGAGPRAS